MKHQMSMKTVEINKVFDQQCFCAYDQNSDDLVKRAKIDKDMWYTCVVGLQSYRPTGSASELRRYLFRQQMTLMDCDQCKHRLHCLLKPDCVTTFQPQDTNYSKTIL